MSLWIRTQNEDKLLLVKSFELDRSAIGRTYIYADGYEVGYYKSYERAMEVLGDIEAQLIKGSSYDDMYGSRRVSKQNIFHMPKE